MAGCPLLYFVNPGETVSGCRGGFFRRADEALLGAGGGPLGIPPEKAIVQGICVRSTFDSAFVKTGAIQKASPDLAWVESATR